jgi:ribonuclease BN (tRNA processing enzyme)
MKVRILGCSGSETVGHNPPGFLVNERVMLDAGTISSALTIEEQSGITDVFISHTHLDHIKALLFLADNVIGRIEASVNIRSIPPVLDAIRTHLMNNIIWPDFTRIPMVKDPKQSVLTYAPMELGAPVEVAGLTVKAFPANHPVPSVGFLVDDKKTAFIYSADTGPNEALWKEAAKTDRLSALIVDTSFPNGLDGIAKVSGHYTPEQLHRDLSAAGVPLLAPIYIYHIKPVYEKKVISELKELGRKNVKILVEGKTYDF